MKDYAIAKLRAQLLKQGIVTAVPVCPTCQQPVTPKQWDHHVAGCCAETTDARKERAPA